MLGKDGTDCTDKTLDEINNNGLVTLHCYGIKQAANEHLRISMEARKVLNR